MFTFLGDRGPVIEALVARTLRMVESSQTVIRVVGLSATLPNYIDVALFLRVNPYIGLFFFDGRFRPVPLATTFIGVKALNNHQQMTDMNDICYEKVVDFVKKGHQVMVFVHARFVYYCQLFVYNCQLFVFFCRNATVKGGMALLEAAQHKGQAELFLPDDNAQYGLAQKAVSKSRNKQLVELFNAGFGCHHAGMLRSDRNLVEKLFGQGQIKVSCLFTNLNYLFTIVRFLFTFSAVCFLLKAVCLLSESCLFTFESYLFTVVSCLFTF